LREARYFPKYPSKPKFDIGICTNEAYLKYL